MTSIPPLTLWIIDDEPLARDRARRMLSRLGGIQITGEYTNGLEALSAMESREPPDVLLLDIQMPGLDGMRLLEALDDPPAVIFATAHEHHAVRAFDLEVADYLLKPYSAERLDRALDRVRKLVAGSASSPSSAEQPLSRIPVDDGRGTSFLLSSVIAAARIEENVVFLLMADGERACYAGTLNDLQQLLPSPPFLRVSRAAIVNLDTVQRYEAVPDKGLDLHLQGNHHEHVTRRRARFVRSHLL